MNRTPRRWRRLGLLAVAVGTAGLLAAPAQATLPMSFDTGEVTIPVSTLRSIGYSNNQGVSVQVPKVSNPTYRVRVTPYSATPTVEMRTFGAGQNGCSSADNLVAGTVNRSITVTPQVGGSVNVYALLRYTETYPDGSTRTRVIEPFGPNGQTFDSPVNVQRDPISQSVCVAD